MSSRDEFLASLGLSEADVRGEPPGRGEHENKRAGGIDDWSGTAASNYSGLGFGEEHVALHEAAYGRRASSPLTGSTQPMPEKKPKAGRRAEPPLDPVLQQSVDAASKTQGAGQLREIGNKCFASGNYTTAIRMYTLGIDQSPNDHVLYSNRSAAYLQSPMVSGPVLALQDAEKCIELQSGWYKGWSRKADALFKQKRLEKALECYRKSCQLSPENQNTKASLHQCEQELQAINERRQQYARHLPEEHAPKEVVTSIEKSRQSFEDVAAAGRSFKEMELMKWRNRAADSRPSSRADDVSTTASSATTVDSSGSTFRGSDVARAYRESLLESFRSKRGVAPSTSASYSGYTSSNYSSKDIPHDTSAATNFIGKAISADSYETLQGRRGDW